MGSPPPKVTVNSALPPSTAAAGSGGVTLTVTGSSSTMTAVAVPPFSANATAPARGPGVAAAVMEAMMVSSLSFRLSSVSAALKDARRAPAGTVTLLMSADQSTLGVAVPLVVEAIGMVTAPALRRLKCTVNTASPPDSSARSPLKR